jgi:hypothetical protein
MMLLRRQGYRFHVRDISCIELEKAWGSEIEERGRTNGSLDAVSSSSHGICHHNAWYWQQILMESVRHIVKTTSKVMDIPCNVCCIHLIPTPPASNQLAGMYPRYCARHRGSEKLNAHLHDNGFIGY